MNACPQEKHYIKNKAISFLEKSDVFVNIIKGFFFPAFLDDVRVFIQIVSDVVFIQKHIKYRKRKREEIRRRKKKKEKPGEC
jgi:hypothetical protein